MKFSINMLLWTDRIHDPEWLPVLERLQGMGYHGVEIPLFDPKSRAYAALGRNLDALGLGRTAVTLAAPDRNPISPDASSRARAAAHLKMAIDCCAEIGAEALVGPFYAPLGEFSGRGRTDDEWKRGVDTLRPVAEHAREAGVRLSIEFLNRFEIYFLNCASDTDRFVKDIGVPGTGTLYDTFHAHIEEKSASAAIAACSSTLSHVHVSENDRGTPGSGSVRWEEFFRALREARYPGWLVIEAFGMSIPSLAAATRIWRRMFADEETLAREGLAFMRRMTGI